MDGHTSVTVVDCVRIRMSDHNLQTEEKHHLRYKANRELIWGFGFFILGMLGSGFISMVCFVLGTISMGLSVYYDWEL